MKATEVQLLAERTLDQAMGMTAPEIAQLRERVERLGAPDCLKNDVIRHGAVLGTPVLEQRLAERSALLVNSDAPHGRLSTTSALGTGEQHSTVGHDGERAS
jgi:hypothetical protein